MKRRKRISLLYVCKVPLLVKRRRKLASTSGKVWHGTMPFLLKKVSHWTHLITVPHLFQSWITHVCIFTGVLDPEELALVNQTFKKPSVFSKQGSHKKPALASKIYNSSGIPKMSFSPMRSHKPVDPKQNVSSGHSPFGKLGAIPNRPDMQNDFGKGANQHSKFYPK